MNTWKPRGAWNRSSELARLSHLVNMLQASFVLWAGIQSDPLFDSNQIVHHKSQTPARISITQTLSLQKTVFVTKVSDKVKQHTQLGVWLKTKPSTIFHFLSPFPPFIPFSHSSTFSFTALDHRKIQTVKASKLCIRNFSCWLYKDKYHQYVLGEPDPGLQHVPWPGCGWDVGPDDTSEDTHTHRATALSSDPRVCFTQHSLRLSLREYNVP